MSDEFKVNDKRGKTPDAATEPPETLPAEIGFANLILSLGTSAMIHLGVIEDPNTKKKDVSVDLAKQEIDIIEMLEQKTTGNLTDAEKKVVDQVLFELRMRYVEATKK